jgi:hypothetical protein
MPTIDEKLSLAGELILKRPFSEEEQLEIYRIANVLGMKDVQSFLHLLLVFKLHEQTMKDEFSKIASLEKKINETLESSIDRVLGEGASRIGADIGDKIAWNAKGLLTSYGEYSSIRGQTILVCFCFVITTAAYWLGTVGFLESVSRGGALEGLLFLPAGWSIFYCGSLYTILWVGDHWGMIRRTVLYKIFLGVQIFLLLAIAAIMF